MWGLPQKKNARRAYKIRLCGHLRRYKKIVKKTYIILEKYDKNNILLSVTNSYSGKLLKTKDHRLKSTKTDAENHGVGLASVYRAVAKYCGTIIIDDSVPGQFKIRVLLYGSQE